MSRARSASAATSLPNIGALTPAGTGRSTAAVASAAAALRAVAPSLLALVMGAFVPAVWVFDLEHFSGARGNLFQRQQVIPLRAGAPAPAPPRRWGRVRCPETAAQRVRCRGCDRRDSTRPARS